MQLFMDMPYPQEEKSFYHGKDKNQKGFVSRKGAKVAKGKAWYLFGCPQINSQSPLNSHPRMVVSGIWFIGLSEHRIPDYVLGNDSLRENGFPMKDRYAE
jgi:hypothetical protein